MATQTELQKSRASVSGHAALSNDQGYVAQPSIAAGKPARQAPSSRSEALSRFDEVFTEAPATRPRDIDEAFRLRYQVYCLDRAFENAQTCPQGMERDRFDELALHSLLRVRACGRPIGTVRLVLPPATPTWFSSLPLTEYAPQESMEAILRLPAGTTAEVSRFAISRAARTMLRAAAGTSPWQEHSVAETSFGEKLLPYMSLGLIRGLVRLSMRHGITHWCLAAEPSLLRLLRNYGLHFQNAGPLVEHRGLRQVCFADLRDLLQRAEAERPEFWDIMTEGGLLLLEKAA